jgi:HTH-type transcriptional regulator/antitoxin HipB
MDARRKPPRPVEVRPITLDEFQRRGPGTSSPPGLASPLGVPLPDPLASGGLAWGGASPSSINSAADLGLLIKTAREGMRLNQQQFADLAGVGRRFISELENGKPTSEIGLVLRACRAAGIDVLAKRR